MEIKLWLRLEPDSWIRSRNSLDGEFEPILTSPEFQKTDPNKLFPLRAALTYVVRIANWFGTAIP